MTVFPRIVPSLQHFEYNQEEILNNSTVLLYAYMYITFNTEVFKLWVGTHTWAATALSLGRGPFRDPQKEEQIMF